VTPHDLAALHAKVSRAPWSADSFASQLAQRGSLLSKHDFGFALGRITLDEVELLQIAIDPSHQRQGYGLDVLKKFEAKARTRGCRRAILEVAQSNARAFALYTRAGWVQDGVRRDYYRRENGQREDAILMSKSL